jgi:PRTRC genetic system protein A
MTMPTPSFGDLIKIPGESIEDWPDAPNPYYVGAGNGLYLHRRLLFGRVVVKQKNWPSNFTDFGGKPHIDGDFRWEVEKIPARIMGQVVNFFKRVYDQRHAEAMVLLTMDRETKEWGTFIPTQLVSGGGINYVYDRDHLTSGKLLVGSIHSHCNMGAFHSGTDTGDADEFAGFHATIGKISQDVPEIVAMVSMNGMNLHLRKDEFENAFDYSEIDKHPAPDWWFRYVGSTTDKDQPIGFELYKKFEKPTEIKVHKTEYQSKPWSYGAPSNYQPNKPHQSNQPAVGKAQDGVRTLKDDEFRTWRRIFGGHMYDFDASPDDDPENALFMRAEGYEWDPAKRYWRWDHGYVTSEITNESKEFNARRAAQTGQIKWNGDGALVMGDSNDWVYWEDSLDKKFVEALTQLSSLSDDDVDFAIQYPQVAGEIDHWRNLLIRKMFECSKFLNEHCHANIDISVSLASPEPPKLLTSGKDSQHV